jgi:flagellar biogenesis protein FliO
MKFFLSFLFFCLMLNGANLINVNFFEGKDKVDVLLSLDKKFDGKVVKISKNQFFIQNVKTDKEIEKNFENFFVKSIYIFPRKNAILLKILPRNNEIVNIFSLTPDEYGIRLRIKLKKTDANVNKSISSKEFLYKSNNSGFSFLRYFIVVAILIFLAIILLLLKKKINNNLPVKNDMKVLSQKFIDSKNKVVLFEFQKKKYLMLIGNTNLLLDVFDEDFKTPKNEVEFDEMLKLHNKIDEIEKYIQKADNIKELDERI